MMMMMMAMAMVMDLFENHLGENEHREPPTMEVPI